MKIEMLASNAVLVFIIGAVATTEARYTADWTSLDARPLPSWYDESKFGIFYWKSICFCEIRHFSTKIRTSFESSRNFSLNHFFGKNTLFYRFFRNFNPFLVTRKLIDISSNSMLDGTAYLSPVMSMSVAKPVTSKRSKRFADSFDEFDMMEKRQVNIEHFRSKIVNFDPK